MVRSVVLIFVGAWLAYKGQYLAGVAVLVLWAGVTFMADIWEFVKGVFPIFR